MELDVWQRALVEASGFTMKEFLVHCLVFVLVTFPTYVASLFFSSLKLQAPGAGHESSGPGGKPRRKAARKLFSSDQAQQQVEQSARGSQAAQEPQQAPQAPQQPPQQPPQQQQQPPPPPQQPPRPVLTPQPTAGASGRRNVLIQYEEEYEVTFSSQSIGLKLETDFYKVKAVGGSEQMLGIGGEESALLLGERR